MTENQDNAVPAGCGRQLRRMRERLGLSVPDIASELRLSGFQIQALEDDDWSQLPGTTYARGYLRSYARLLGLDADQLLAGASTQEIEIARKEPEIDVTRHAARQDDGEEAPAASSRARLGWVTGLMVAVLAAGYWHYRTDGAWMPVPGGAGESPAVAQGEVGQPAVPGTAAADAPRMPSVPNRAVFRFRGNSWADVRDASGARLLYRDIPSGRRIEVEGRPPFRVFLGNARAVQVEYMGNVITPDSDSERLYARFVLGEPSG